jgi:hypothetical protein
MGRLKARSVRFETAAREVIENRPYTAVGIALAIGWLLGRMHRPLQRRKNALSPPGSFARDTGGTRMICGEASFPTKTLAAAI